MLRRIEFRTVGLALCVAAALLIVTGPAPAAGDSQPTTSVPSGGIGDPRASRGGTRVQDPEVLEALRQRAQGADASIGAPDAKMTLPPCYWTGTSKAERDVAQVDIADASLSLSRCNQPSWDALFVTHDSWAISDLYVAMLLLDLDLDATTGCDGADITVVAVHEGQPGSTQLRAVALRTPSCRSSTWATAGPVTATPRHDTDTTASGVYLGFDRTVIGNDEDFAFAAVIEDVAHRGTDVDRKPNAGFHRIACGPGQYAFHDPAPHPVWGAYDHLTAVDVDGDGRDDLVFVGNGSAPDGMLRGTRSDGLISVATRPAINGAYSAIAGGDFDGDGGGDVFLYGAGGRPDGYLRGTKGSMQLSPVSTPVQVSGTYTDVVAGDVNGDGYDDLFFYGPGSMPDGMLRGSKTGLHPMRGTVQVSRAYDGVAVADVNGDGYDDVAFYGRGLAPEGLLLGGPTWLHAADPGTANGAYDGMFGGDFDGDGYGDLFFHRQGRDCEGLLRGTASGLRGVRAPGVDEPHDGAAAGDFNGDGRDDLFFFGRGAHPEFELAGLPRGALPL
jgi:hypothetical protein